MRQRKRFVLVQKWPKTAAQGMKMLQRACGHLVEGHKVDMSAEAAQTSDHKAIGFMWLTSRGLVQ